MRTQEEILKRIDEIKEDDFFGTETSDLIEYLEYKNAKQFLKKDVTKKDWKNKSIDKDVLKEMKGYIDFA